MRGAAGTDGRPQIRHVVVLVMENHLPRAWRGVPLADEGQSGHRTPGCFRPGGAPARVQAASWPARRAGARSGAPARAESSWSCGAAPTCARSAWLHRRPELRPMLRREPAGRRQDESFAAEVIYRATHGAVWANAMPIWTCDENGGYYDHLAPPAVPVEVDSSDISQGVSRACSEDPACAAAQGHHPAKGGWPSSPGTGNVDLSGELRGTSGCRTKPRWTSSWWRTISAMP
jgi:hypothetical protein